MNEIKITWNHGKGTMHIFLDRWMEMRSITKFKKLVKIINKSDQPEILDVISEWCSDFIEQSEPQMKTLANMLVGYKDKIPYATQKYEKAIAERNHYRRGTKPYKAMTQYVKNTKSDLQELKNALCQTNQKFTKMQKMKDYCTKCLEILSERR